GILEMQKNWVGRKEGVIIKWRIDPPVGGEEWKINESSEIETFTTRVDTIFGVTFVAIGPEVAQGLIAKGWTPSEELNTYQKELLGQTEDQRQKNEKHKEGMSTGLYVQHPFTKEKIPVWLVNYIVSGFGTGAVMGVPGHDQRDYDFAKTYGIDVRRVISAKDTSRGINEEVNEGEGTLSSSDLFTGLSSQEGREKIQEELAKIGKGNSKTTYHLRDWIFSRQRYWGEPIPMIYCENCGKNGISFWDSDKDLSHQILDQNLTQTDQKISGFVSEIKQDMAGWFPLAERNLPLKLPYLEKYSLREDGKSPLEDATDWVKMPCPHCGSDAKVETDTMPNWAGSCWYFLAFASKDAIGRGEDLSFEKYWGVEEKNISKNWSEVFKERMDAWMPVNWYLGGAEHAVLHLLYARFWMHALYDLGLVKFKEPFQRLHNVGMLLAEDGRKMSKSWGNVINPDDIIKEYGADTLRVYEMFMAPFNAEVAWSTRALQGAYRFVTRIWQIYNGSATITDDKEKEDKELYRELQKLITKIDSDITDVKYNTPISSMMSYINLWESKNENGDKRLLQRDNAKVFLQLLAPFAPYISEEIWSTVFNENESIHLSSWPAPQELESEDVLVTIPIQVMGKVRDTVQILSSEASEKSILDLALKSEKVKGWIEGKDNRVIYVPGKIMNIILSS
ncbi:MAG: class I tRNA ligase family protein, partial [Candidatus Roizmanbacteria bacterium]